MKSILIITPFLPYPIHSGGEQAQYNMINELRNFYRISMAFPLNQDNHRRDVSRLAALWPEVKLFPFSFKDQCCSLSFLYRKGVKFINRHFNPFRQNSRVAQSLDSKDFIVSRKYRKFLDDVISKTSPDIIQVEFLPNLNIIDYLPKTIRRIFIHHEIGFVITERFLCGITLTSQQQRRANELKTLELERLNHYDAVVTLTETDQKILLNAGVERPIFVSPAAVNTKMCEYSGCNGNLIFVGGYHHRPNQEGIDWFLNSVAPLISWSDFPHTELRIIGLSWPQKYEGIHEGLRVRLLGYVDDLAPHAAQCIMIVPLQTGSGMRMKILDAAALSLPLVSTSVGAEGLLFKDGKSCMIGDTPKEFASKLMEILTNNELCKSIAQNAHDVYLEHYTSSALVERRKNIYRELLSVS